MTISKDTTFCRQPLNQGDNHQCIKIFQPGSQLLMYWDLIGIIINIISLWLSPFQAAFTYQSPIILIVTIIMYLFLEILVNLNRSTISFGEIITTRSQIIKHYLQGQGAQDIISLIIWIIIFNKPKESLVFEILQIIQIIVTTKKVITNFDKFFESLYSKGQFSNLIDLFSLVITIFFFAHITACVWYYVGEKSDMLLDKSWLKKYEIENESIMMKYNYSIYWAIVNQVLNLYYTTTIVLCQKIQIGNNYFNYSTITVGYMKIRIILIIWRSNTLKLDRNSIHNNNDVFVKLCLCILTQFYWNYFKEYLRYKVQQKLDLQLYQYKKMLLRINDYMDKNNVEVELQLRARNFIKHHLFQNENQESQEEINNIMEKLPEDLRNQITKSIQLKILNQITFLKDLFSTQAVTDISRYLETQYLVTNDIVFQYSIYEINIQLQNECIGLLIFIMIQEGENNNDFQCVYTDSSLYNLFDNKIDILYNQDQQPYLKNNLTKFQQHYDQLIIIVSINRGEKFGEYSFFTGLYPKYSAKCMSDAVLYKIQREKFLQIIQYYQKDFQRFHNIKDQILLYSDYSKCISSCQNCRVFTHEIIDCPLIQYKPNLEQRIKFATFKESQNLRMFYQRSLHKSNCRKLSKNIEISIKAFQDENESKVQVSDYLSGYLYRNTFEDKDKNNSDEPKSKIIITDQDNVQPSHIVSASSLQQKRHQTQFRSSIIAQIPKQRMTVVQQDFKSHNNLLNNSFHSQSINKLQSELLLTSLNQTCLHLDKLMNYKDYMPQNNILAIIIQLEKNNNKQSKRRKRELEDLNKYTFYYYVKTMAIKLRKLKKNIPQ